MEKLFLFAAAIKIQRDYFAQSFSSLGISKDAFVYETDSRGYFKAEASLASEIDGALSTLHDDIGGNVAVLCAHQSTSFELKLLQNALRYFPNQCCFPSDVILREMSFGDFSSFSPLSRLFRDLPRELLLTAGAYLRCGMDSSIASKRLGIHRNTFRYRLDSFVEKTGLDIRDYHNALLLELYFDLSAGRM